MGAIRERIKKGLGARGMIKGRVGTGTKNQPQEGFIRLSHLGKMPAETVNYLSGSSSSGSPQRKDLVPPNQNQQFSMCESETIFTLGTDVRLSSFLVGGRDFNMFKSSNSFPDICEDTFTVNSADCSGAHSACPSFGPSAPSMPAFELSPISGSSDFQDEEAEFCASDSISISSGHDIQTSDIVSRGVGLGITGVRKHDGSGQFDGMGLASIQWIPRSPRIAHEANTYVDLFQLSESLSHMSCDRGDTEISDTFLQEAAVPYIQDPFHIHSFATIPECHSWSEFDLALFSS